MTAIDRILQSYRDAAVTEREKGTYFERLALVFFLNDPVQAEEYDAISTWGDWAKANGWDAKDVGIDLVAKLRNEDGFAAIQAKILRPRHPHPEITYRQLHLGLGESAVPAAGGARFNRARMGHQRRGNDPGSGHPCCPDRADRSA